MSCTAVSNHRHRKRGGGGGGGRPQSCGTMVHPQGYSKSTALYNDSSNVFAVDIAYPQCCMGAHGAKDFLSLVLLVVHKKCCHGSKSFG